jgi:ELWxxDGT repeat protein
MYLTGFRGTLHFDASDGVHGTELWRSDGTEAGTTMLKDLNPAGGSNPGPFFAEIKGISYFFTLPGGSVFELWRTDGTAAGTTFVKGFKGGTFGFTVMKRTIYLSGERGLWRSDGTRRGTTLVKGRLSFDSGLISAKGTLYFITGTEKKHGQELWRSDGTRNGTKIFRDIHRGPRDSRPLNLLNLFAVGHTLFFTAEDKSHGRELWRAGPKPCDLAERKCKKRLGR